MDLLSKKVIVSNGGGNKNSTKVTIPIEMVKMLDISPKDYVMWTFHITEDGEKYLTLKKI